MVSLVNIGPICPRFACEDADLSVEGGARATSLGCGLTAKIPYIKPGLFLFHQRLTLL
jgi:hypothetical protein